MGKESLYRFPYSYFRFYMSWWDGFEQLDLEQRGAVLTSLVRYAITGKEEPPDDPIARLLYSVLFGELVSGLLRYQRTCEKNAENGKLSHRNDTGDSER